MIDVLNLRLVEYETFGRWKVISVHVLICCWFLIFYHLHFLWLYDILLHNAFRLTDIYATPFSILLHRYYQL